MSETSHLKMHRDHTNWRKEDDLWRDELATWEQEINQAIQDLPRLEQSLRAHAEALEQHAAAIRLYEQEFLGHEHNVAEYERRQIPLRLLKRAQTHAEEAEHHQTRSQAHEEFKERQHRLLANWKRLFSEVVASPEL